MAEILGSPFEEWGWNSGSLSAEESIFACKYKSGSAGKLKFIFPDMRNSHGSETISIGCGIYDSSFHLLPNGATERQNLGPGEFTEIPLNFPIHPTVEASTDYWLVIQADIPAAWIQFWYAAGETNQVADMGWYQTDSLPDPYVPMFYYDWAINIFAEYEEEAPIISLVG